MAPKIINSQKPASKAALPTIVIKNPKPSYKNQSSLSSVKKSAKVSKSQDAKKTTQGLSQSKSNSSSSKPEASLANPVNVIAPETVRIGPINAVRPLSERTESREAYNPHLSVPYQLITAFPLAQPQLDLASIPISRSAQAAYDLLLADIKRQTGVQVQNRPCAEIEEMYSSVNMSAPWARSQVDQGQDNTTSENCQMQTADSGDAAQLITRSTLTNPENSKTGQPVFDVAKNLTPRVEHQYRPTEVSQKRKFVLSIKKRIKNICEYAWERCGMASFICLAAEGHAGDAIVYPPEVHKSLTEETVSTVHRACLSCLHLSASNASYVAQNEQRPNLSRIVPAISFWQMHQQRALVAFDTCEIDWHMTGIFNMANCLSARSLQMLAFRISARNGTNSFIFFVLTVFVLY